ncbi:hypothetical protein SKAU_G00077540 [Synaphobranchus kaupii]|uniref:Uncharacterized protein n=1 Tax=Synaphobranchus kaupii TaxID=118154 RepID=A0A9Q1JA49_SYNKA|nr:hypothetical protein SKAU_G00077540 [Synaphobranchus kaupii]
MVCGGDAGGALSGGAGAAVPVENNVFVYRLSVNWGRGGRLGRLSRCPAWRKRATTGFKRTEEINHGIDTADDRGCVFTWPSSANTTGTPRAANDHYLSHSLSSSIDVWRASRGREKTATHRQRS